MRSILFACTLMALGCDEPPEASIVYQTEQRLSGVWGSSAADLWIGTDGPSEVGAFIRFDGASNARRDGAIGIGQEVLWGSSANDVWAWSLVWGTRNRLQILHFDGTSWSPSYEAEARDGIATLIELRDAWGSGPNDVWFVGERDPDNILKAPLIIHYDGSSWTEVAAPAGVTSVSSVWTGVRGDVWLAADGRLFRDQGAGWQSVAGAQAVVELVRGTSAGEVFVSTGSTVERWNEGVFEPLGDTSLSFRRTISAMWVDSSDSIWTLGSEQGEESPSLSLSCEAPLCIFPTISRTTGSVTSPNVAHWNGRVWRTRLLNAFPYPRPWSPGDGRLFFISGGDDPKISGRYVYSLLEWTPID